MFQLGIHCLNNYFRDLKKKKTLQKRQTGDYSIIIYLATGYFEKIDMYIYFDRNICEYQEQTKIYTFFNMIT